MKSDEPIKTIAVLGTLPPIRALSSYCFEFSHALSALFTIKFISFKSIYPAFLYPGGNLEDDQTYPEIANPAIQVKRRLTWYNPLSWLIEGCFTKADLLHVQWWSLPLFPIVLAICRCFKFKGKPIVFTVHNVLSHERSRLYEKLSHLLFKSGDHFIVHSEIGRQQMSSHYNIPKHRISVIQHGSLDFHLKKKVDCRQIKREMGFGEENKIILLFGAIRPYKGIDTAIKALPEIVKHFPEARLLIAGKLWEDWTPYERLIQEFDLSDYIKLHLEYIPSGKVHRYFEISDLVIFPYRHFDSQSGAGATAVSFRKPMIVSNVGGLPELVGNMSYIVEPDDSVSLANKIIKCFKEPGMLSQMTASTTEVSKRLDWSEIAIKIARVYKKASII